MKFKYTGDCEGGFVVMYGVKFKKGKSVTVEDPVLIKKLQGNSHFSEVKGKASGSNEG